MITLHKSTLGNFFWIICTKVSDWKFEILVNESSKFNRHLEVDEKDGFFYVHFFSENDGNEFIDNVDKLIEQHEDDYVAFCDAQF